VSERGVTEQGDRDYVGATPSWVIWQVLQRFTKPGDTVLDPMCGSGTTLDVCRDVERIGVGFDLAPSRDDIQPADARQLPLADRSVDLVFIDPPYSTHVDYSDDPRCIGKLDAGGDDRGRAYYEAMDRVFDEADRVLRPDRVLALFVSDSYRKGNGHHDRCARGNFMPIGFDLFRSMRRRFAPLDIVAVVRHSQKLEQGNWRKAAEEENFFLRGFSYLFLMRKPKARPEGERRESPSRKPYERGGPSTRKPHDRGDRGDRGGSPSRKPYERSGPPTRKPQERGERGEWSGSSTRKPYERGGKRTGGKPDRRDGSEQGRRPARDARKPPRERELPPGVTPDMPPSNQTGRVKPGSRNPRRKPKGER